jgi:predicted transport protein
MAVSPEEQEAGMIARLPEQTGRSLDEWKQVVKQSGLTAHGQLVKLLKSEHGVTHGYANLIVHKALRSDDASVGTEDDLVDAQYAGKKAELRPIYDAVIARVQQFGADVELAPKKAYVSLRRSKQFGILQPGAGRLDVGINLKNEPATERLEPSGSFNAMVSHRVRITNVREVDDQLIGWLRTAYDRA